MSDKDICKNLIIRLNRIEGQVKGVKRMIENQAECKEILTQIAAIKAAVQQVGLIIFENHATECIVQAHNQDDPDDKIKEVVLLMGRLMK
jgi:DNA-binding FrmR family transcriptional regulator